MPYLALVMLAAGVGVPVLAALNAQLGRHLGSPAAAATVLFAVGLACSAAAMLVTGPGTGPGPLARLATAPRHLLLGGALVAFYILSVTYLAPRMGIGNAIFAVLLGQLVSAAAIDHFGLFGANVTPLNATRTLGLALMAGGVWVTRLA